MGSRYGLASGYEDDPVWTRAEPRGYEVARPTGNTMNPMAYQPSYQPSPTNIPQHTTIVHSAIKPVPDADIYRVGVYGWRKNALYAFILFLTVIVFTNLALTVWIMSVLDFSLDGIGALKVEKDGIKVLGRSEFEKPIQFSRLSTPEDQALTIDSSTGVTLNAHNFSGYSTASLDLNPDGKASAICERFEVLNSDRRLLFFVDSQEIGLKLENLRILDDGGSIFEGAIQTAVIRPEPDSPLSLESPTRSLTVEAGQDIELLSSAGEIQFNSLLDINLKSKQGDIRLESGNVYMSGLERSTGYGRAQNQLCICQNGRLFMAAEKSDCRADRNICDD
ncbi:sarcoglycan complex subunit protein [Ditylenchus destructor]|nr:sarcoglycan complex subunit protein [Ditylenchus destructor]